MSKNNRKRRRKAREEALQRYNQQQAGKVPRSWSDGRIRADDDGDLMIKVGSARGKVIVEMAKPAKWIGMPPETARQFANNILKHAAIVSATVLLLCLGGAAQGQTVGSDFMSRMRNGGEVAGFDPDKFCAYQNRLRERHDEALSIRRTMPRIKPTRVYIDQVAANFSPFNHAYRTGGVIYSYRPGYTWVRPYTRSDGTSVRGHFRRICRR